MPSLNFLNISFGYEKNLILENINYTFQDNGFYVIIGKSGSGKTTLLSLAANLLQPTSGEIKSTFKTKPSLSFQSPLLIDYLTILENVSLPLILGGMTIKEAKELAIKAIEEVHLDGFEEKYPNSLSGGEKIRVSIARALVKNSQILIFDEPTGQLDESNSLDIYKLIKDLSLNHLVILVTHDENNAFIYADKVLKLENKQLVVLKDDDIKITKEKVIKEKEEKTICFKDALTISGKYLLKHKLKVILSSIFLIFSFLILYLGLNINFNVDKFTDNLISSYYSSDVYEISQKEIVATSGNLKLEQYSLPKRSSLLKLKIFKTYTSLDAFVPSYKEINLNGKYSEVRFLPTINQNKSKIKYGETINSFDEVVVNTMLLETFKIEEKDAIGKTISVNNSLIISGEELKSVDLIEYNFQFKIVGICKEKKAFSSPIIYYDYNSVYSVVSAKKCKNISQELEKDVTILNVLNNSSMFDLDLTSRKLLFCDNNINETIRIANNLDSKIKITSISLELKNNTNDLVTSLTKIILIFLALVIFSSLMLEFLTIYSLYDENIRLFAITKIYSSNKKNIRKFSLATGTIFFTIVFIFTTFLSVLSSFITNLVLNKYGYPKVFALIDLKSLLIILLSSLIISLLACLLPLRKIKDSAIKRELEGED
jgi:ABC-type nitrate/sulfonate/bicarbonate transport system ATPase subunit